jgi:hypothetical protein
MRMRGPFGEKRPPGVVGGKGCTLQKRNVYLPAALQGNFSRRFGFSSAIDPLTLQMTFQGLSPRPRLYPRSEVAKSESVGFIGRRELNPE